MTTVASVSESARRVSSVPLHRLEWARRRLDHLSDGDCCMFEFDEGHYHDPGVEEDEDLRTLKDLLDDLIEEARP